MSPKLGRRSFFTPEGKVTLMFLKMHTGVSGPKLLDLLGKILKEIREIERGNGNAENLLTVREKNDLEIITKMYRQQMNHFRTTTAGKASQTG